MLSSIKEQDEKIIICSYLTFKHLSYMFPQVNLHLMKMLQEGGPLPGPKSGLLSNAQKWIVWRDTHADKARDFIGKEHLGRELQVKETQESCFATWLTVSGFMVMGLVPGLSLANTSDSRSFLVALELFSQEGCQREGFWEMVGHVASAFDLSQTLLVGGSVLVPCSLLEPPVIK